MNLLLLLSSVSIKSDKLSLQGKSLSLICGILTWLRDYEDKKQQELDRLMQIEQGYF